MTPPTVWTVDLKNGSGLRGADVGAAQLILGRHLTLDEFSDLAVDVAQFLGHLAAEILVDLNDLETNLRNLALRLCRRRGQLGALAGKPRRVAFKLGQACELHEIFGVEIAHAVKFAVD